MKFAKYGLRGFVLFIVFALVFTGIAVLVANNWITPLDHFIIKNVQSAESPFLTSMAKGLSFVGSSQLALEIAVITMVLLIIVVRHRMELVLFLWVVVLGSQILNTFLKLQFHRERPSINQLIKQGGYSFPSGHSMTAFSLYVVIAYLLWHSINSKAGRGLLIAGTILLTVGIGWSRVYLGVHYPSDVLGGYAASGAWLMLSIGFLQIYRGYQNTPS
ncbi:phosphatase PAP2 family protein [Paenibacillus wynnii]|uniref:Phospholipid phosphatase n=1 Tax=Paenibacillus wynnii TaxID=268407 RepID=A0A098M3Z5_9BACL|nr:phosphatase PAP2 family protein [Paenibacillus wynnii]KGE16756.1 phospholipid phosphatase [Paenibacillus wynnii]